METKVEKIDCTAQKGKIRTWKWVKPLLVVVGTIFVGLGIIGIILPVLPTTPFLLLAAACYAKSSKRFYCWLLNNRWFGVYIKNYREKKGMPLKIKIFVVALLWLTILVSVIFAVQFLIVRVIFIIIALGVSVHILSMKTLREK